MAISIGKKFTNDLKPRQAIGISLFDKGKLFNQNYTTKDQIKHNLINVLLTRKGERVFNNDFGANLSDLLFEPEDITLKAEIESIITYNINKYIPQISLKGITIKDDSDHSIYVEIQYVMNTNNESDSLVIIIS